MSIEKALRDLVDALPTGAVLGEHFDHTKLNEAKYAAEQALKGPAEREDGGTAFPFTYLDGGEPVECSGMSLRDYYAGQALAGLTARPMDSSIETSIEHRSDLAYRYADAMLEARKR